jgi:hypothetical protein
VPSKSKARTRLSAAAIALTLLRPDAATGAVELAVVPLPSWPYRPSPQQLTVLSACSAHEKNVPATTDTASETLGIVNGEFEQLFPLQASDEAAPS